MGLTKEEQFNQILSMGKIKSVYQPIISLKDGEILGYEALSRIRGEDNQIQIAEMFELAGRYNKVWELEQAAEKSTVYLIGILILALKMALYQFFKFKSL